MISAFPPSSILGSTEPGRSLLTAADVPAQRSLLGLGTLATQSANIADYLTIASAIANFQPLNSNLTAIAELSTAAYGRSLLTQADAPTARTTLGLGTGDSPTFNGLTVGNFTVDSSGNANFASASNIQINRTNDAVGNSSLNLANAFGLQITATGSNLQINRRTGGVWSNVVTFANADGGMTLGGQTLTGSSATSLLNLATTWNTTGTPTAILLNVTDTASNAASLLMDLRVGGVSRSSISKTGNLRVNKLGIGGGTPDFSTIHLHLIDTSSDSINFLLENRDDVDSPFPRISFGYGGNFAFGVTAWQTRAYIEAQNNNGLVLGSTLAPVRIYSNRTNWNTGITLVSANRVLIGGSNDDGTSRLQVTGNASFSGSIGLGPGGLTPPDALLFRDAANILAQRNGVNAQTLRVYNTFTDGSNHERGKFAWETNILRIGTERAGTGSARALEFQTDGATRMTISAAGVTTISNLIVANANIFWAGSVTVAGSATQFIVDVGTQAFTGTSGSTSAYSTRTVFSPTSGTMLFTGVNIAPTINQTGGANGITRGVHINPTLTAAADFRAIDIAAGIAILAPSVAARASLRIPSGTAPTSPVDGDIWFDGTALRIRIGGVTRQVNVT